MNDEVKAECRMQLDHGPRTVDCGHSSFIIQHSSFPTRHAFTLIELLAVIAIMGIIAAVALPSLHSLKPNASAAASRQLLDAVTYARQLALSHRTTVYMIFVPPKFWTDSATSLWAPNDWTNAANLYEKQLTGYTYVSLRSIGDQPGVSYPQYLTPWRTLPQGAYISYEKFIPPATGVPPASGAIPSVALYIQYTNTMPPYQVFAFNTTNGIPFPSETNRFARYVTLPYIAFDAMGQLVSGAGGRPEYIPITEGSAGIAHDPNTRVALQVAPTPRDAPSGNTTNNFNLVYVDQLTGRARIEHTKVQ
jgi:prepilin-type N-terminal cleavage/methylation domain-containing protein